MLARGVDVRWLRDTFLPHAQMRAWAAARMRTTASARRSRSRSRRTSTAVSASSAGGGAAPERAVPLALSIELGLPPSRFAADVPAAGQADAQAAASAQSQGDQESYAADVLLRPDALPEASVATTTTSNLLLADNTAANPSPAPCSAAQSEALSHSSRGGVEPSLAASRQSSTACGGSLSLRQSQAGNPVDALTAANILQAVVCHEAQGHSYYALAPPGCAPPLMVHTRNGRAPGTMRWCRASLQTAASATRLCEHDAHVVNLMHTLQHHVKVVGAAVLAIAPQLLLGHVSCMA